MYLESVRHIRVVMKSEMRRKIVVYMNCEARPL